jgi:dihydrofolate reductase
MTISFVVAAARNNGIGKEGKLPWHLPNDLKHFKNITWGLPVIMGRKTFESMGKALPGRKNIIITRQAGWSAPDVVAVKTVEDALFLVKETDVKEAMIVGGGEIFKLLWEKANRIYMTRVDAEPEADTFFPAIDPKTWHLVAQKKFEADEKNAYTHSFQVWERI